MNTRYTKGPWRVMADPNPKNSHPYCKYRFVVTEDADLDEYVDPDGNHQWALQVGSIICAMRDLPNLPETARLIAAAPELLEALKTLTEACRAMADPEHCLHVETRRMGKAGWAELVDVGQAALNKAQEKI